MHKSHKIIDLNKTHNFKINVFNKYLIKICNSLSSSHFIQNRDDCTVAQITNNNSW